MLLVLEKLGTDPRFGLKDWVQELFGELFRTKPTKRPETEQSELGGPQDDPVILMVMFDALLQRILSFMMDFVFYKDERLKELTTKDEEVTAAKLGLYNFVTESCLDTLCHVISKTMQPNQFAFKLNPLQQVDVQNGNDIREVAKGVIKEFLQRATPFNHLEDTKFSF